MTGSHNYCRLLPHSTYTSLNILCYFFMSLYSLCSPECPFFPFSGKFPFIFPDQFISSFHEDLLKLPKVSIFWSFVLSSTIKSMFLGLVLLYIIIYVSDSPTTLCPPRETMSYSSLYSQGLAECQTHTREE